MHGITVHGITRPWTLKGWFGAMCHVARIRCTWVSSCSHEGALAEYTKELRRIGIAASADQPKDLVTLNVGVARVLDLTAARERKRFGVSLDTLAGDDEDDLESCRLVADLARLAGYDAILSPSASLAGARNLNLYIDGRADHLRLMEGPERTPLNY